MNDGIIVFSFIEGSVLVRSFLIEAISPSETLMLKAQLPMGMLTVKSLHSLLIRGYRADTAIGTPASSIANSKVPFSDDEG